MRPRYPPLKRFAAVLLSGIIAAAVWLAATTSPSTQEPLNLVNPPSYGSAFADATPAAAVRRIGANDTTTFRYQPAAYRALQDACLHGLTSAGTPLHRFVERCLSGDTA